MQNSASPSRQLHQRFTTRCAAHCVAAVLMLTCLSGCNYAVLLGYLIGGPPSIEPDFEAMTHKSMTDLGVNVAVVCYAPTELKWDFEKVDLQLAQFMSVRLGQHHIETIHPTKVQAWLDQNPEWDKPEEIGEAMDAEYVIYVDIQKYSLYEPSSQNFYRGRSEAMVSVIEMSDDGTGEKVYSKEIVSEYPLRAPRSTSEVSYQQFKREYLTRLSEEIGRLFYEYYSGDDIADAI